MAANPPELSILELKELILQQVACMSNSHLGKNPKSSTRSIVVARDRNTTPDRKYYAVLITNDVTVDSNGHETPEVLCMSGRSSTARNALDALLAGTQDMWNEIFARAPRPLREKQPEGVRSENKEPVKREPVNRDELTSMILGRGMGEYLFEMAADPDCTIADLKGLILEHVSPFYHLDTDGASPPNRSIIVARVEARYLGTMYYAAVIYKGETSIDLDAIAESDLKILVKGYRGKTVREALEALLQKMQELWHEVMEGHEGGRR